MFRKIRSASMVVALMALVWMLAAPLLAQQGEQFPAGTMFGNDTAAQRTGRVATMTAMLDRAFGSTKGFILQRGATVWAAVIGRTVLIVDTTFWRRVDGSNSVCNGTANAAAASAPNCAYADWNPLYSATVAIYDFGGKTITLKSGTTDTATSGLTMATAFVGGGGLIIDLNGSNIAETVTKGIVNNAPQSGGIGIQNSAGLGVGGNISSSGFACIQNSAEIIMGIGAGISTGPCFDAAYESIQGATLALAFPVNSIGAGGNQFVLTATGGNFGFNGQKVNVRSNQTYTLGTVSAQLASSVTANGATFDLNPAGAGGPFTISGPRYSVTGNSFIYTGGGGGGGPNFFPGSTAGALVSDSGGCYDSTCYGSLADGTPILGSLLFTTTAIPAAPAAGKSSIYAYNGSGALQSRDTSGNTFTTVLPQTVGVNTYMAGVDSFGFNITKPFTFDPGTLNNCILGASVASNNLTISLLTQAGVAPTATTPCNVSFRNATAATGDYTTVAVTAATAVVFNSGSGFGAPSSSTPFRIWVTAWNNAGTVVLGASNQLASSATNGSVASIDEGTVQSSTACSACATATAAQTFYTTAAQTSKAIRILGYMDWASGLATTGVWASGPTTIQMMGPGVSKPGESIKRFFVSTSTATSDSSATFVATQLAKNFTKQSAANLVRLDTDGTITSGGANGILKLQFHRGSAACTTAIGIPTTWNSLVSGQLYFTANRWIDVPAASGSATAQYTVCMNSLAAVSVSFPSGGANGGAALLIEEIMGANDNEKFGIPEEKTA